MKVVIVGTVASSIFGFRMPLIKTLIYNGYDVYAFAIDYSAEQKETLNNMGVKAFDYSLSRSGLNLFSDLKMMFALKKQFKKIQPDIVFSYFVKPVIYATLAAYLAKVPKRIAMLEGLGYVHTPSITGFSFNKQLLQFAQGVLFSISFRFSNRLIFLNPDDPKDLSRVANIPASKVNVLGGIGLELKDYTYSKPDTSQVIRFIFIARLLAEKGIYQLLDAMEIVREKYPEVELVILGAVDESSVSISSSDLDDLINKKLIIYPGQVSNVNDWLIDSHVFVLPSYYREGVPRSTQEAMAIGRPILTTDVPGCRETVIDGKNGFLVPAFDVGALADRMIWFIENPDRIQAMGQMSRTMAEDKFDVHKVNEKLMGIMGLDK